MSNLTGPKQFDVSLLCSKTSMPICLSTPSESKQSCSTNSKIGVPPHKHTRRRSRVPMPPTSHFDCRPHQASEGMPNNRDLDQSSANTETHERKRCHKQASSERQYQLGARHPSSHYKGKVLERCGCYGRHDTDYRWVERCCNRAEQLRMARVTPSATPRGLRRHTTALRWRLRGRRRRGSPWACISILALRSARA